MSLELRYWNLQMIAIVDQSISIENHFVLIPFEKGHTLKKTQSYKTHNYV